MITIYLDLDENNFIQGWGTSKEPQGNTFEVEVPTNHSFFTQNGFGFWYLSSKKEILKDENAFLELLREGKLEELNQECQKDIVHGFDYNMGLGIFHFYYSDTDQTNMIQNKYALEMGEESVPWRGYDKNEEPFDFEVREVQFNAMFKEAVRVKNHKLKLLREYYPSLLSSLGSEEKIRSVKWDSSIEMG